MKESSQSSIAFQPKRLARAEGRAELARIENSETDRLWEVCARDLTGDLEMGSQSPEPAQSDVAYVDDRVRSRDDGHLVLGCLDGRGEREEEPDQGQSDHSDGRGRGCVVGDQLGECCRGES